MAMLPTAHTFKTAAVAKAGIGVMEFEKSIGLRCRRFKGNNVGFVLIQVGVLFEDAITYGLGSQAKTRPDLSAAKAKGTVKSPQ